MSNGTKLREYALTVKRNGNTHCPLTEIDKTLAHIRDSLRSKDLQPISRLAFERDSRGTLHAHARVQCRPFLYTRVRLKNWHIYFEELLTQEDIKKWDQYLKKSPLSIPLIQQYDAQKYYSKHNGFI